MVSGSLVDISIRSAVSTTGVAPNTEAAPLSECALRRIASSCVIVDRDTDPAHQGRCFFKQRFRENTHPSG